MGSIINSTHKSDILPGKRVIDVQIVKIGPTVFAQLVAEHAYILQWPPFPPSKLPIPMVDLDLHLIDSSLGHPSPQSIRHLDRFVCFCRAH